MLVVERHGGEVAPQELQEVRFGLELGRMQLEVVDGKPGRQRFDALRDRLRRRRSD